MKTTRNGKPRRAPEVSPSAELLAPCGMNCLLCSSYQARAHGIPRARGKITHCTGCRARNKQCAYLKGQCTDLRDGLIGFCFSCNRFPCLHLRKIDRRYRMRYGYNFLETLAEIRARGAEATFEAHLLRYACTRCGGPTCIHNRKCYHCDIVTSWSGNPDAPRTSDPLYQ